MSPNGRLGSNSQMCLEDIAMSLGARVFNSALFIRQLRLICIKVLSVDLGLHVL